MIKASIASFKLPRLGNPFAMCRVQYYCCCTPLRVGCMAIGIVCIIFAVVVLIFAALKFGIHYDGMIGQVFVAFAAIDIVFCALLLVFSIMLICGAIQMNACLLAPWSVFSIMFVTIQATITIIDIYLLATHDYVPWVVYLRSHRGMQLQRDHNGGAIQEGRSGVRGRLLDTIASTAYLIYSCIVVCSYWKVLVTDHEGEKRRWDQRERMSSLKEGEKYVITIEKQKPDDKEKKEEGEDKEESRRVSAGGTERGGQKRGTGRGNSRTGRGARR